MNAFNLGKKMVLNNWSQYVDAYKQGNPSTLYPQTDDLLFERPNELLN